jgi:hypothetical protein
MIITHFGSLNSIIFSLAVDTFRSGALLVKLFVLIRLTVNLDTHPATCFNIDMFKTANPFSKLLVVTRLRRLRRKQPGTTQKRRQRQKAGT